MNDVLNNAVLRGLLSNACETSHQRDGHVRAAGGIVRARVLQCTLCVRLLSGGAVCRAKRQTAAKYAGKRSRTLGVVQGVTLRKVRFCALQGAKSRISVSSRCCRAPFHYVFHM